MTFAFVYQAEAHSCDEWPVGHGINIKQPKTSAERLKVAEKQLRVLGVGDEFVRLVDSAEDNNFHKAYASWPFRWYTIGPDGRLTTIPQPGNSGYEIREFVQWVVRQVTC